MFISSTFFFCRALANPLVTQVMMKIPPFGDCGTKLGIFAFHHFILGDTEALQ